MLKRLLTLFTLVLLLTVFSIAQAQEAPSGDPIFVLTEEQINADFTIPSTATRTVSNVEVDVQSDGVHISFDMTVTRNGTSNTLSIIAILIAQVQENRTGSSFYDLLISSFALSNTMVSGYSSSPPPSVEREVNRLVTRAWRNYLRNEVEEQDAISFTYVEIEDFFVDDSIYVYGTEGATAGWCLECSHE